MQLIFFEHEFLNVLPCLRCRPSPGELANTNRLLKRVRLPQQPLPGRVVWPRPCEFSDCSFFNSLVGLSCISSEPVSTSRILPGTGYAHNRALPNLCRYAPLGVAQFVRVGELKTDQPLKGVANLFHLRRRAVRVARLKQAIRRKKHSAPPVLLISVPK